MASGKKPILKIALGVVIMGVVASIVVWMMTKKSEPQVDTSKWPEEGFFHFRHDLAPAEMKIQSAIYGVSGEIERCHQIEKNRKNPKYPKGPFVLEMEFQVSADGEFSDVDFTFDGKNENVDGLKNCIRGVVTPLRIPPVEKGLPKFDVFPLYFKNE